MTTTELLDLIDDTVDDYDASFAAPAGDDIRALRQAIADGLYDAATWEMGA